MNREDSSPHPEHPEPDEPESLTPTLAQWRSHQQRGRVRHGTVEGEFGVSPLGQCACKGRSDRYFRASSRAPDKSYHPVAEGREEMDRQRGDAPLPPFSTFSPLFLPPFPTSLLHPSLSCPVSPCAFSTISIPQPSSHASR